MNLSCSSRMIKYLMFVFNLLFVISGIIIIAIGVTVKTVYTEYETFLSTQYFTLPNMLIATGVFIFIISFFGCCGAVRESWIMLGIFSILLCIIFIFEFASGIAGYVLKDQTADFLEKTLRENLDTYNVTHGVWDLIQRSFDCCGVDSYDDWKGRLNQSDPYTLPISCCPTVSGAFGAFYCNSYNHSAAPSTTTSISTVTSSITTETSKTSSSTTVSSTSADTTTVTNPDSTTGRKRRDTNEISTNTSIPANSTSIPYSTGCKSAFGDYIRKHALQIGGCALGLAIVQILGICFSCHLVRQLKNGYYST
ncbi:CD63 antigen-like isoform X1 [Anthonomus grandis grandis]|uniref:CD63 antigen-like isoform X1 n=1 Tax=Anthonomus grandis grandis TaxID=2921223 RepID=UPI002165CA66|nr:CD63 antigen-like isoform X1 [Anthonomus grandis grandis]